MLKDLQVILIKASNPSNAAIAKIGKKYYHVTAKFRQVLYNLLPSDVKYYHVYILTSTRRDIPSHVVTTEIKIPKYPDPLQEKFFIGTELPHYQMLSNTNNVGYVIGTTNPAYNNVTCTYCGNTGCNKCNHKAVPNIKGSLVRLLIQLNDLKNLHIFSNETGMTSYPNELTVSK